MLARTTLSDDEIAQILDACRGIKDHLAVVVPIFAGLRVDQARWLKELEQENSRLKKLVADLSLDSAILKEV